MTEIRWLLFLNINSMLLVGFQIAGFLSRFQMTTEIHLPLRKYYIQMKRVMKKRPCANMTVIMYLELQSREIIFILFLGVEYMMTGEGYGKHYMRVQPITA